MLLGIDLYPTPPDVIDQMLLDGFFKIRGFKKGTMHFEFLDEEVWARFNMEVARIRGWQLPKTRTYKPRR